MGKWARRLMDYFTNPLPTFFDICVVVGVLPISYIDASYRGIYFTFFSIFLICLSRYYDRSKSFQSIWVTLLLLWAFLGVFIHAWVVNENSFIYHWINFSLMSEGFIYILFGTLLFTTIAEHGKNIRLLYVTIPIAIYPTIQFMISHGQISFIGAFIVATIAYAFLTKRVKLGSILCILAIVIAIIYGQHIMFKLRTRPDVWVELLKEIIVHPFVGAGFNHTLSPDNMIIAPRFGYLFRHNDYLSIAGFLGLPILIPIVMILKELFVRFRRFAYVLPFLAFCIAPIFQLTMFQPEKALQIVALTALFYVET